MLTKFFLDLSIFKEEKRETDLKICLVCDNNGSNGLCECRFGFPRRPVPMGTTVDLGDGCKSQVLSVIPDATNVVHQENQFNNPAKDRGSVLPR